MVIKIFKISTMEMWTFKNKNRLINFIKRETNIDVSSKLTIDQLVKYLSPSDYYRVK